METIVLNAKARTETGRQTNGLRAEGFVPAVVYGRDVAAKNLTVHRNEFMKAFQAAGESSLIDLTIEGEKAPVKVLVHDVQEDILTNEPSHIDFRAVRMDEKLEVEVALNFVGIAPAAKNMGGTFVGVLGSLQVRCLPAALVKSITVDITGLNTFEDKIRAKDVQLPEGMELMNNPDAMVAHVEAPRSEEEMAALDKAVELDASKVEVAKKEKKDEDAEAAEGEAKAEEKK